MNTRSACRRTWIAFFDSRACGGPAVQASCSRPATANQRARIRLACRDLGRRALATVGSSPPVAADRPTLRRTPLAIPDASPLSGIRMALTIRSISALSERSGRTKQRQI
jgi:hypothetical protein